MGRKWASKDFYRSFIELLVKAAAVTLRLMVVS